MIIYIIYYHTIIYIISIHLFTFFMNRFTLCKNIQKTYYNNCNDLFQLEIAEIAETELKLIGLFIGLSGIIYLKNNKNLISECLFHIGYHSFLAVTKISNAYTKIKNYFVSSTSNSQMNRQNKTQTRVYDEIKVIKNGVRNAHFETMETFKESCYLGNPNDYYDMDEVIEDSSSTSSASSASSASSFDSDANECSSSSSPLSPSSTCEQSLSSQPLFIMEKNESSNTIDFKTFDFIMHTNYMYPESTETSGQNYTKIYRTFGENDFYADKSTYKKSNAEMIICNIEIEGDEGSEGDDCDDIEEYEIELTHPYNFNVVGNIILDEKFVYWYMLKKYNYALNSSSNYKVTCITKDIKTFQLDRSCGLRVNLNDYEKVNKPFIAPPSSS